MMGECSIRDVDRSIRVIYISPHIHVDMLCVIVGVYCCLFNKKWIITGGGDGLVIVWDATTGLHRLTLSGHTEEIVRK